MKKLIAFDLDGTLTQHRSPLSAENKSVLDRLKQRYKLCMVGAGDAFRIYTQMGNYDIDIIGNYGMQQSTVVGGEFRLVKNDKTEVDKDYFNKTCEYLRKKYGYTKFSGESVEFHESGMITFPLLGTTADIKDKIVFDPTREKRRLMYKEVLELFPDYVVFIGGSSSFDFSKKQYNKYDALMKYAKEIGVEKDEILYVGDDFEEGGGDSHVRIFGMDYVQINDYRKLPEKLEFLLK